ncbi:MAG: FkbM family methyltransferase [Deltaproteobacteria bacterium]|nr:FkbM family methyltransferase [Deltaproteobacteria bacterium]
MYLTKRTIRLIRMAFTVIHLFKNWPTAFVVWAWGRGDTITLGESQSGNHSMFGSGNRKALIDVVSPEDVFTENAISSCEVLKMDCEGAEFEILYSTPTGVYNLIQTIALEVHASRAVANVIELKKFLGDKGFMTGISKVNNGYGYIYASKR